MEHVKGVGHDTVGGVFNRHDPVIRPITLHFSKNFGDRAAIMVQCRRTESLQGGHLGESPLRPPKSDRHRLLKGNGGGDDFAKNRKQGIFWQRAPTMELREAQELVPLALRGKVAGTLIRHFLLPYLQGDVRPLVQQRDELGVNGVNLVSQVFKAHGFLVRRGGCDSCAAGSLDFAPSQSATMA